MAAGHQHIIRSDPFVYNMLTERQVDVHCFRSLTFCTLTLALAYATHEYKTLML